jgi:NAD+ synthase (glutamine-hydrolysing)
MERAAREGAKLLALPELCITSYSCSDLFLQDTLLAGAQEALRAIACASRERISCFLSAFRFSIRESCITACAAVCDGKILGLVPKTAIPNYGRIL